MTYDSTIEDLVDSVVEFIDDNINSYVGLINTAKGDGLTLSDIRKVEVTDQDPYSGSMYPRVQLYVDSIDLEHIASGYDDATMSFIGLVAIGDQSDQRTRLLRYTEAMRQCLRDANDLGVSEFDVDPRGMTITYYPTMPDVNVGVALIRFQVRKTIPN